MRVLSLDCESDGLYGPVWAIGAALHQDGAEPVTFSGRIENMGHLRDRWVLEHVVPVCADLPSYRSAYDLLQAFTAWWQQHKEGALVVADFAVPVEARLFRSLVEMGMIGPFDGPYPLHELGTMLLAAGVDPDVDRRAYAEVDLPAHDPLADAAVSLRCWLKAVRSLGDPGVVEAAGG